jgi:carbohydrate kinase (thermoresistant glucokinase family)
MGVTGCGKTTLGQALAERLALPFHDADDYHPDANRQKLRSNIPLDDNDRLPWLQALAASLQQWEQTGGAVLACSALKESYRAVLRTGAPDAMFVHLKGDKQFIAQRLAERAQIGHDLIHNFDHILDGQYRDLEEPHDAITVPVEAPVSDAVDLLLAQLSDRQLSNS